MAGSACFMPKVLPESLEIENRKRLALLSNLGENMNHLLGDRPVFLSSPCLDLTIEPIRHVLDIQGSHVSSITPPLWRNLGKRSSQRCEGQGVKRIDQRSRRSQRTPRLRGEIRLKRSKMAR